MTNEPAVPSKSAFVLFRPGIQDESEQVSYNDEAFSVLTRSAASEEVTTNMTPYILSLCRKWTEAYEEDDSGPVEGSGMRSVAILHSQRRKYCVKGVALSKTPASEETKQYLFIMEREASIDGKHSAAFRRYKLSNREQELALLILAGDANKEIAWKIKVSENTVKGYMKSLMRKLGVSNRSGIVATLFTE